MNTPFLYNGIAELARYSRGWGRRFQWDFTFLCWDGPNTLPYKTAAMREAHRHGRPQRQVAPLVRDELVALLSTLDDKPAWQRNRALLLLGFAGALRRSELVGLQWVIFSSRPPV